MDLQLPRYGTRPQQSYIHVLQVFRVEIKGVVILNNYKPKITKLTAPGHNQGTAMC